jgi:hypothetical protein
VGDTFDEAEFGNWHDEKGYSETKGDSKGTGWAGCKGYEG